MQRQRPTSFQSSIKTFGLRLTKHWYQKALRFSQQRTKLASDKNREKQAEFQIKIVIPPLFLSFKICNKKLR